MTVRAMDNAAWAKMLRDRFNDSRRNSNRRPIKLPAGLAFGGGLDRATIAITPAAIGSNMQTDAAAFDGWAFVLMRWLSVGRLRLGLADVAPRNRTGNELLHFERFAFRVGRFCEMVPEVEIEPALETLLGEARLPSSAPTLNVALTGRDYEGVPEAFESEAEIELFLCHNPQSRKLIEQRFGLERLCRQFPVGLFHDKVSAHSRLFPGGKSAIDLIGVDSARALHVFELKKPGNATVGAVSELILYVTVLDQARSGNWRFASSKPDPNAGFSPADVLAASAIKGHLLARGFHPLVDDELVEMISSRMAAAGWAASVDRQALDQFLP